MLITKIFITGGAGCIGSYLGDRLLAENEDNEVTIYDNLSSGKLGNLPNGVDFRKADLLDYVKLDYIMQLKKPDIVFHLAANPDIRKGIDNTRLDLEQETIATYNVLESMRLNKVKKIVFSSSSAIYGEAPTIPIPEYYGPLLPTSLYGAGKLACEGLISAYCHTFDMQAWILRFANIVGDRATHGVIYDFIEKLKMNPDELEILGDGSQEKTYLHVSDCIEGMLYVFGHSNDRVNVFNLGNFTTTNVTEIATMLCKQMGIKPVFKYTGGGRGWVGDVPQVRFDVTKINLLGWHSKYNSTQAVGKAIKEIVCKSL